MTNLLDTQQRYCTLVRLRYTLVEINAVYELLKPEYIILKSQP